MFVGREAELEQLRELLKTPGSAAAIGGLAGLGKTMLALEFAHRHFRDFEGVYWVQCEGRNLAALAGDLDAPFGLKVQGDLAKVARELRLHCQRKRYLLVFDNVENEAPGELVPGGRSSVLVTSRLDYIAFLDGYPRLKPELFTEDECLAVFRHVLGEAEMARSREAAKALLARVGYLPIAVSVAAGLIKHDVHYTIESLARQALHEELGNRDGLQASYGNQALILADWGRLEAALELHKKEEAICEELGNRDGLQRSFNNQAGIGRPVEALTLYEKQEAICEDLGNRESLQRSYNNQALILQDWGRLEEALALHKKQEAICLELGLRSMLAYCWWSMATLARKRGNPAEALKLAFHALAIFTELQMPRERDAVQSLVDSLRTESAGG